MCNILSVGGDVLYSLKVTIVKKYDKYYQQQINYVPRTRPFRGYLFGQYYDL